MSHQEKKQSNSCSSTGSNNNYCYRNTSSCNHNGTNNNNNNNTIRIVLPHRFVEESIATTTATTANTGSSTMMTTIMKKKKNTATLATATTTTTTTHKKKKIIDTLLQQLDDVIALPTTQQMIHLEYIKQQKVHEIQQQELLRQQILYNNNNNNNNNSNNNGVVVKAAVDNSSTTPTTTAEGGEGTNTEATTTNVSSSSSSSSLAVPVQVTVVEFQDTIVYGIPISTSTTSTTSTTTTTTMNDTTTTTTTTTNTIFDNICQQILYNEQQKQTFLSNMYDIDYTDTTTTTCTTTCTPAITTLKSTVSNSSNYSLMSHHSNHSSDESLLYHYQNHNQNHTSINYDNIYQDIHSIKRTILQYAIQQAQQIQHTEDDHDNDDHVVVTTIENEQQQQLSYNYNNDSSSINMYENFIFYIQYKKKVYEDNTAFTTKNGYKLLFYKPRKRKYKSVPYVITPYTISIQLYQQHIQSIYVPHSSISRMTMNNGNTDIGIDPNISSSCTNSSSSSHRYSLLITDQTSGPIQYQSPLSVAPPVAVAIDAAAAAAATVVTATTTNQATTTTATTTTPTTNIRTVQDLMYQNELWNDITHSLYITMEKNTTISLLLHEYGNLLHSNLQPYHHHHYDNHTTTTQLPSSIILSNTTTDMVDSNNNNNKNNSSHSTIDASSMDTSEQTQYPMGTLFYISPHTICSDPLLIHGTKSHRVTLSFQRKLVNTTTPATIEEQQQVPITATTESVAGITLKPLHQQQQQQQPVGTMTASTLLSSIITTLWGTISDTDRKYLLYRYIDSIRTNNSRYAMYSSTKCYTIYTDMIRSLQDNISNISNDTRIIIFLLDKIDCMHEEVQSYMNVKTGDKMNTYIANKIKSMLQKFSTVRGDSVDDSSEVTIESDNDDLVMNDDKDEEQEDMHSEIHQSRKRPTPQFEELESIGQKRRKVYDDDDKSIDPKKIIRKIRDVDVFSGNFHTYNKHPGNIVFRELTESSYVEYDKIPVESTMERKAFVQSIMEKVKCSGGRFLRKYEGHDSYYELDDKEVVAKIVQTLGKLVKKNIKRGKGRPKSVVHIRKVIDVPDELVPPTELNLSRPGDQDYVSGNDNLARSHPGNQRFWDIIRANHEDFVNAENEYDREAVYTTITRAVRAHGRFLSKDPMTRLWNEMGDFMARKRCYAALRRLTLQDISLQDLSNEYKSHKVITKDGIYQARETDVFSGGNILARNHPGNVQFRSWMDEIAETANQKKEVDSFSDAQEIVRKVHDRDGRLLKPDKKKDRLWHILDDDEAHKKTRQLLLTRYKPGDYKLC